MEFVQKYKKSLCPDSFSIFLSKENSEKFNEDVKEATNYLHNFLVPQVSESLIAEIQRFINTGQDLHNIRLSKIVKFFSLFF